ncbi:MAG TPA: 3-hydroxyacyl-CoA dehydrogenase NAD-binding domain-containing protein [Bdellovibrionales bacterium]|nr:3-hydroxyacyl-CoA dehydrogenase NAD-binding domain-containing protein [Bdellovibrionales bacterium]
MSIQESIRIVPKGDVALVEWDLFGEKVNKLSSPVMARFREVIQELSNSKFKAVVFISRKSNIFIAGADIEEIRAIKTKEAFGPVLKEAHSILNSLEDMNIPVIAAIHGACLGGGCELVLACDYRIATDDSATRIGLPEVKLGIIPGFGGCVRLPRTVGLQASLDIILQGKSVDANKALKIGLVDQVVHPSILENQAIQFAESLIRDGKLNKRRKKFQPRGMVGHLVESPLMKPKVFSEAYKMTMKATSGHYPAPIKAIEVIKKTYGMSNREKALDIEMAGFCDVAVTDVSKHLINVFFLMEGVKKKSGVAGDVKPLPVKRIGVLGAGTMGGGIAFVAADRGIEVRMKDINNAALALGFSHARSLWSKLVKRKRINNYEFNQKMNLVTGGLDFAGFGQLDVVVEAIVEDMNIKKKVIGETAKHCRADAIIATNTSSLSVSEMSKGHPNPENFVGMHFFNPVDKMPLVEVIRGDKTSDVAVATIFDLSKKMGKLPVVVKDGPGFLVNRLLLPYLIEAAWLLEDGMSVEKVDNLYKKHFGMPMGPFALLDEIGIDVGVKVAKIFHETLGERIMIAPSMKKLGESGRFGKKNKKGFYRYDEKGKAQGVDQSVYADLGLKPPTDKLSDKEVLHRGLFTMVNEAALALIEERIVETPDEVDLAMITGTGFPPFRGGLLRWADTVGTQAIADELEVFATQYGIRFKPSTPLRNMAKNDRKFY